LLSEDSVAEEDSEVEQCLSPLAQPAREASAKAARQGKIKVERRMEVFVIFINATIRQELIPPIGSIPHNVREVFRCKHQAVKTDSKKKSMRLGEFISPVYDVYFPYDHDYYGTDADHMPVIPGNDFAPDASHGNDSPLQHPVCGNMDMGLETDFDAASR